MKYTNIALQRHQNAAKKSVFSNSNKTANFAPLWKTGAMVGGGLGAIKGGLDQNEDGTQIDPASRLMNVGINAGAGAALVGGASAGIPELIKENGTAKTIAQGVFDTLGVNLNPDEIPMTTADRIRHRREQAKRARANARRSRTLPTGNSLGERIKRAIDPVTGRLEIFAEDVGNLAKNVKQGVGKVVENVQTATAPDMETFALREAFNNAIEKTISDETTRLTQEAIRTQLEGLKNNERLKREAVRRADKTLRALDMRNPVQKGIDAVSDIAPKAINTVKKAGNQAAALPFRLGQKVRSILPFSYMGDTADFYSPYTKGALVGSVLGTGIGTGIGISDSISNARNQEQAQLDQIQAIVDPYVRKKEWDVYDADLSRVGRKLSYVTQGAGNTLATAGLGAAGGALLGGSALTIYDNLKNTRYGGPRRGITSRMDGLKVFLTGNK